MKTGRTAFTLVEVMIAVVIFFVATFAILELMTQMIKSARSLTQNAPTAGMVAADYSMTNKIEEGIEYGDFNPLYPGYTWERDSTAALTNGFFQVDITIFHFSAVDSRMSLFLYRPDSPQPGTTRTSGSRFR